MWLMETVRKTVMVIYLPPQKVSGLFLTWLNKNLQDFTSYNTNFLDFRFLSSNNLVLRIKFQEERMRFGNR